MTTTEFWVRVRFLQARIDAIPYSDRGAYAPREGWNALERATLAFLVLPPRQEDAEGYLREAEDLLACQR